MKKLILALVLASCVFLLYAGGNNETDSSDEVADLIYINDNPPFEEQNVAMGEWIKSKIGIGFVPESYPDLTTYQTTLRQSLLSPKTAPDFFKWWSNFRIKALVDEGLLEDVSDIWQIGFDSGLWPKEAAAEVTFNGKQYALPYHYSHWGMIYNKKVYKELGIDVPTTWEDFLGNCRAIKDSGRTPISLTLNGRWQSTLMWTEVLIKTDPDLYLGLVDGSIKFADPRILDALQNWIKVFEFFPKDLTIPWGETFPRIYSGDFTMAYLGDWLFTGLESIGADMETDIGWFPVPSITPKGTGFVLEISPMAIPVNSPNKESTKKLMTEWMTEEGQRQWVKIFSESTMAAGGITPDKKIYDSVNEAVFADNVRYMPRWYEAAPVPLIEYTMDKFAEVILNSSKLESAMKDIDDYRSTLK